MMLTGYSGIIHPGSFRIMALIGFAFPAFMFANMAFLLVWALVRIRNVIVPIAGFLLCYSPVQNYFPFNVPSEAPEGCMKVLSYNVYYFNEGMRGTNPILKYIVDSDADIVCLQEYYHIYGQDSLWNKIDSIYQYQDTIKSRGYKSPGADNIALLSKYPIIEKHPIHIVTAGNTLGVFKLNVNGDTVHVINAHLETVGLSEEEKSGFSNIVHGKTERGEMKRETKFLARKIADASVIRAAQADSIDDYIRRHRGERIIVCGDFNDHPLSYVHNTVASRLTDCYRASGHWAGYTFHYHSMHVRIDHIMCSEHWKPYQCTVDKSIDLSDHYPVYCYLQAKK